MWAPLALLAILQLLFSVPYLQWDEWDAFAPMIDSSLSGADLLAFFWQHHNVHRHPLAKILYWLTLQLTPSTQPLMWLSLILVAASFSILIRMLEEKKGLLSNFQVFLVSALYFSLSYVGNFFSAMNICWTLIQFAVVFFCYGLAKKRWPVTLVSAILAFLSIGLWPIFIGIYLLDLLIHWLENKELQSRLSEIMVATVIATLMVIFYFSNSPTLASQASPQTSDHLRIASEFFLLMLGLPFHSVDRWLQIFAGLFFLGSGLWICIRSLRAGRKFEILLIAAAVAAALLISYARSVEPVVAHERYTSPLMPAWVAIAYCWLKWGGERVWMRNVGVGFLSVHLVFSLEGPIRRQIRFFKEHEQAQVCLEEVLNGQSSYDERKNCMEILYPDESFLPTAARLRGLFK